jgi:hypothetical protein
MVRAAWLPRYCSHFWEVHSGSLRVSPATNLAFCVLQPLQSLLANAVALEFKPHAVCLLTDRTHWVFFRVVFAGNARPQA